MDRRDATGTARTSRPASSPFASATSSTRPAASIPIFRQQIAQGRPGHGHAPRDDAVLHDDPGSRAARRPGGRDRRPRPGVRARHGRAGADRRSRREDDHALRQGARPRYRRSSSSDQAGREAARGARRRRRDRVPSSHESILLLTRAPVESEWLEAELRELERLVDEGDTLEVSAALSRMVSTARRA